MAQNDIDDLIAEFNKTDENGVNKVIEEFSKDEESLESENKALEDLAESIAKDTSDKTDENDESSEKLQGVRFDEKEHKVIDKLDEINKESEDKVNKLFEKLEAINEELDQTEKLIQDIKPFLDKHKEFMDFFVEHFPKTAVKNNYEYFKNIINIISSVENNIGAIRNNTFDAMDILQFQDITRQKIERVMSVIKALHNYLNNWFSSSSYEDVPRARVAHTIVDEKDKESVDQEVDDIIKQMQEKGEI
jgi:chemotaxis regulatin CheY-phosphate phosphatase CheZ